MTEKNNELATIEQRKPVAVFAGGEQFETAQRMAQALAQSDMVPVAYKGKIANCLVALELANRTGSSVLVVMQNLNVIHGRPGWNSQYIIAAINSSKRFTPLKYKILELGEKTVGQVKIKDKSCVAYAADIETYEIIEGPPVTMEMAVREGWYGKSGSKWQTMPDLMLRYRAATFFGRLYCPDILLGMQTEDEARDVGPDKPPGVSTLNDKIKARQNEAHADFLEEDNGTSNNP